MVLQPQVQTHKATAQDDRANVRTFGAALSYDRLADSTHVHIGLRHGGVVTQVLNDREHEATTLQRTRWQQPELPRVQPVGLRRAALEGGARF